jgi:hypothetical protein
MRAFDLSGGEAAGCHDSQRRGGNGNGETRKAAHLESGARDLHTQGTGARAAEGTQGRHPAQDTSLSVLDEGEQRPEYKAALLKLLDRFLSPPR